MMCKSMILYFYNHCNVKKGVSNMKNLFKRALSFIIAVTVIFSSVYMGLDSIDFFAVKANAATEKLYDGYFYIVTNKQKKTCKITGMTSDKAEEGEVEIPEKINSYTVTEIGDSAFSMIHDLTEVTIPKTVKKIGYNAFDFAWDLEKVNLKEGLTEIGIAAFKKCDKLTSITIPGTVKKIEYDAFSFCSGLESVTLKKGLTVIGDSAFRDTAISKLTIPSTVKTIESLAFYGCENLKTVTMSGTFENLGSQIFSNCSITSVKLPGKIQEIPSRMFENCNLKSITFPKSVKAIGEGAFCGCDFSGTLTIPGHIKSIAYNAFGRCNKLKRVYIEEGLESISSKAFSYCENLISIYYPDSVKEIHTATSGSTSGIEMHANEGSYAAEYFGASNHNFTSKTIAESCSEGYTLYSCKCGYSYKDDIKEPIDTHDVVNIPYTVATNKAAGCTEGSYCSKCGTVFKQSKEIPQIGSVTLSSENLIYDGKVKNPSVRIKTKNGNSISSSNYTVSMPSSKAIGTYTCTITFKGDYKGKYNLKYKIVPKGTKLKNFERSSGTIKVLWKAQPTNTTGYQIQYGKKKYLSDGKFIRVKNTKTTERTIKKLQNSKYYFRVRTYKVITKNGKKTNYYSPWSQTSLVYATNKATIKVLNQYEKCRDFRYDDYYSYQYAFSDKIRVFAEIRNPYRDFDINKVILYKATSKNGTYKKLKTFYENDLYGENTKRLSYYDEKVVPDKAYYYKVMIFYVPDYYRSSKGLGSLLPEEKIYDHSNVGEYRTAPPFQFELRSKGPWLSWRKIAGVEGYQVREEAYEVQGYNIFGQPVYGIDRYEYLTTSVGGRSKIYSRFRTPGETVIRYSVYPYQKINGYYYCHYKEVRKKLPCSGYEGDVCVGA